MNSIYLLNKIVSYQPYPEKLLSCCKQFTVDRKYNIRWKNRIYYRDNRIKIINIKEYDEYYDEEDYMIIYESWYKNGKRHRDDIDPKTGNTLHAYIDDYDTKIWYKNGEKYRDDIDPDTGLLLYTESDGYEQIWYKDGKKHRDEIDPETGLTLPAKICEEDRNKSWWKNDKLHRDEIDPETGLILLAFTGHGIKIWYKDGKKHRDDKKPDSGCLLPAYIHETFQIEFWINDMRIYRKSIFSYNR